METKVCSICKEEKSLTEFYPRSDRKGYRSYCKVCWSVRRRDRYRINKEKEGFSEKHALASRRWRRENAEKQMFMRARARAGNKGLLFEIQLEDIAIPDKFDSTKGYTKDNIVVISYRANRIKNDSSLEEIEKLYKWLTKNRSLNA
jgi:hypothetical protein